MKRKFVLCAVVLTLIATISQISVDVNAYDPAEPFCIFYYTEKNQLPTAEYFEVWKKSIADKNFTLRKGQNLRIEPIGDTPNDMTDSRLVINNGATATIKGDIFIERSGVLDIDDGTVIIDGGSITNCGTIKIGKKGTLKVLSGTLNSTAAGSIEYDGKITCLTSGKKLDSCFKSIKKYDSNFNLSDFALLIDSKGNSARITTNYCINDIMTNYKYRFDLDTSGKKIKIVHTNYSLETVYNSKIQQKLQKRVSSFENEHTKECNFKMWYWKDYGYSYNYKSNELVYNAKWFSYDGMNEKFIENHYFEKA